MKFPSNSNDIYIGKRQNYANTCITYIKQIPRLWFGQRIEGLRAFSRAAAGKKRVSLNNLLSPYQPQAHLRLNCEELNARAVRKLIRRAIRLNEIDNPRLDSTKVFSEENIIHQILSIEAKIFSPEEIVTAYNILNSILLGVKRQIRDSMTPEQKLKLVYKTIQKKGLEFIENEDDMFVAHLLRNTVDCDASSLVVFVIGQELGWPVKLAMPPGHVFVRWQEKEVALNIDRGKIYPDSIYLQILSWSGKCLDFDGIIAFVFFNLGNTQQKLEDHEAAILAYNKAINLLNNAEFLANRGIAKRSLGNYEEAMKDFRAALSLDVPDELVAHIYDDMALTESLRGQNEQALLYFDKAIYLNPFLVKSFVFRGLTKLKLKQNESALKDFQEALRLGYPDPDGTLLEACELARRAP